MIRPGIATAMAPPITSQVGSCSKTSSVGERKAPEEPREGRNEREEEPDPDSEPRCPPLADERDAEQDGHEPVEHREKQQRHGVEHRFCFVAHGVWP